jgi:hypothetical protein
MVVALVGRRDAEVERAGARTDPDIGERDVSAAVNFVREWSCCDR